MKRRDGYGIEYHISYKRRSATIVIALPTKRTFPAEFTAKGAGMSDQLFVAVGHVARTYSTEPETVEAK